MGRAASCVFGQVILYCDRVSPAMKGAIEEVERRREVQLKYNEEHGIIPHTVKKAIRPRIVKPAPQLSWGRVEKFLGRELSLEALTPGEKKKLIVKLRREMRRAARELQFEKAAQLRDLIESANTRC